MLRPVDVANPVHAVQGSPAPSQLSVRKKPWAMQEVFNLSIAYMSAGASPGEEISGRASLLSIPCPHSWSKMAAISPVFRHSALDR